MHKRPDISLHNKFLNLFTIKINSFQGKHELITTSFLLQYLLFVVEAIYISEEITECRCGALLEISDAFSSKLNVSSYMILQCRFN